MTKKALLTIGFTLAGIFTSPTRAQIVPLTFDQTQSSITIDIQGSPPSSSTLSGTATVDLQNLGPPSGNAQITQLELTADQSLDFSFVLGVVTASTTPGDVVISLVTPGAPSLLTGSSFDQLNNVFAIDGDLVVSDPFGLLGGNQTIDLSMLVTSPLDINSVNVTQSGNVITVSNNFTIVEMVDLGAGLITLEVDVAYVATGTAPAGVLLGDVNLDGVTSFLDIAPFISVLSASGFQAEADCNEDGMVNFLDISFFINILSGQ